MNNIKSSTVDAFVAIGSNIRPEQNVRAAIRRLALHEKVVAISTVYRSPAEGRPQQPRYYNCVVQIETAAEPEDLRFHVLRCIEEYLGRERSADKCAARTIDLDLVGYANLVMETPDMTLPDEQIAERPFLAIPLTELAPDLILPRSGLKVSEAAAALFPHAGLEPLKEYTDSLRREFLHES